MMGVGFKTFHHSLSHSAELAMAEPMGPGGGREKAPNALDSGSALRFAPEDRENG